MMLNANLGIYSPSLQGLQIVVACAKMSACDE
jgi:hypothetical protein